MAHAAQRAGSGLTHLIEEKREYSEGEENKAKEQERSEKVSHRNKKNNAKTNPLHPFHTREYEKCIDVCQKRYFCKRVRRRVKKERLHWRGKNSGRVCSSSIAQRISRHEIFVLRALSLSLYAAALLRLHTK